MTTPLQGSPDGAITIGGGEWKYGQVLTEQHARDMFELPDINHDNMLDVLRIMLTRLPVEALKPFADFLGVVDGVFLNTIEAAEAIIDAMFIKPIMQTVDAFNDWVTNFFDAMGSGLVTGDLAEFGAWWDSNVSTPIFHTIDGFIRGALGLIGSGFNVNIVEDTAKSLADAIASMNEVVTRLDQQYSSGKFTGVAMSIPFAQLGGVISPPFTQTLSGTGTGSLIIDGLNRIGWSGSATNRTSMLRFNTKQTNSDYQKVGVAYSTMPSTDFTGGSASYNYIYGRANAAFTSYVYTKLGANVLELGCYVSGAKTVFATLSGFRFKPGVAYWLECGTTGGIRIFRVWENSTVILTYTDASTISALGNRYVGLGGTAFTDYYVPASAAALAFFDNVPATVRGCGWRVARTNTTTGSFTSGTHLFNTSWFNTTDYMSDDLAATYDATNNKITVPADGWYAVTVNQFGRSGLAFGTGGAQRAALYKNGSAVQYGPNFVGNSTNGYSGFGGVFTVYCSAGDYLQPGYESEWSASNLMAADAGGIGTFWAGTFLGNKKAE